VGAVAQVTGVAHGTIHRYFPTRQALLTAILDQALLTAEHHLTQANLATVPVAEGLARAMRALVALGDDFLILVRANGCSADRTSRPSPPSLRCWNADVNRVTFAAIWPLLCQVEALYALAGACLRAGELAATWPPREGAPGGRSGATA
jgi:AcrR family transcriptional regulator